MVLTEDDFGKGKQRTSCRAPGVFTPRDSIGRSLQDLESTPPCRERDLQAAMSLLQPGTLVPALQPHEGRRLKRTVFDKSGRQASGQRESSPTERPQGLRCVERVPKSEPAGGPKRTFPELLTQKTGYENPKQYEDAEYMPWDGRPPFARPSHPISPCGMVATEHTRCFPPEIQYPETGLLPPAHRPQLWNLGPPVQRRSEQSGVPKVRQKQRQHSARGTRAK
eukprot:gnl/TRDRNA2_/TRDRNA2_189088_c0_seq1.p1 gnl/TRDRNA2_/TRDRNA2_189088_c0~~gnl/TRDRNA2_/TRDRNA2_189088_c0_seq1.p1  ORF type:complete len:223 (+),score=17.97 gnl/TRDRNA2_/TRDRNA2_189088_c0_seq1:55-723(+)